MRLMVTSTVMEPRMTKNEKRNSEVSDLTPERAVLDLVMSDAFRKEVFDIDDISVGDLVNVTAKSELPDLKFDPSWVCVNRGVLIYGMYDHDRLFDREIMEDVLEGTGNVER
jgi:hypothetical protein